MRLSEIVDRGCRDVSKGSVLRGFSGKYEVDFADPAVRIKRKRRVCDSIFIPLDNEASGMSGLPQLNGVGMAALCDLSGGELR